jgi:hypothetical protein
MNTDACEQLIERERLDEEVGGAELEAAQLGRKIRAGGEDQDGHLRPPTLDLSKHAEAVDLGEEQVEDDEVVLVRECALKPPPAVVGDLHFEPFSFESARDERVDPGLVLDD